MEVPLTYEEENITSVLSASAKSENETLNEHLVKTMRLGKIDGSEIERGTINGINTWQI